MSDGFVFGGDSVDIPAGTYPATCISVEVKNSAAFGDFRAWDFELSNGSVVGGSSSMSMGSRSKGARWAVALLGRTPERGEVVNPVGRPCLVVVEESESGWPKVVSVLPPLALSTPAEVPLTALPNMASPAPQPIVAPPLSPAPLP